MSWPNGERVRERMISDLIANERALKESAQQVVKEFRGVLFTIAQQVASEKVREMLRADPAIFNAWSPAQWQAFFKDVFSEGPWGASRPTGLEPDPRLETEIRQLRESALFWQHKAEQLEKSRPADPEKAARPVERPAKAAAAAAPTGRQMPNGLHTRIYADLSQWSTPKRPARFLEQVSPETLQWRRQGMALYLLSRYGLSARIEIEHLVGKTEGLRARPGSLRNAVDLLIEHGLLESQVLYLQQDTFKSALALLRLTGEGRALCQICGWPAVQTEWERLEQASGAPASSEQIFGVLSLAMHARLRGCEVTVLPDPAGNPACELAIEQAGQRVQIAVNLVDQEPPEAWGALEKSQGYVAFCGATRLQREQLAAGCRRLKWAGMAADLETLVPVRMTEIDHTTNLWAETWPRG